MKRLICCLAIAAIGTLTATAQDGERNFKRFKGDLSLGYAAPLGASSNGGIFALEPKFGVMDKLYLGLRMEGAVIDFNGDLRSLSSYIATADYYFTKNYSFRPFVGAGAGIFEIVNDVFNSDHVSKFKFGGIIRAGAEVKHFRFGIEYNFIPDTDITAYDNVGNVTKGKSKTGYIGIKAGFCFGGGPL